MKIRCKISVRDKVILTTVKGALQPNSGRSLRQERNEKENKNGNFHPCKLAKESRLNRCSVASVYCFTQCVIIKTSCELIIGIMFLFTTKKMYETCI